MKKKVLFFAIAGVAYLILSSYSKGGQALDGVDGTGAKGGGGCSCHNNSVEPDINLIVELDSAGAQVDHYVGGKNYTIKISGRNNTTYPLPKFGFRATAIAARGAGTPTAFNLGTLANSNLPKYCQNTPSGSFIVVEHTTQIPATSGNGTYGTTYEVNIPWVAPEPGSGSVIFYSVLLAVNNDGKVTGDKWNKANYSIDELGVPFIITGNTELCVGSNSTLKCPKGGGVWSSSNPDIVFVGTNTGNLIARKEGTATIKYTLGQDELATSVLVNPNPTADDIMGFDNVCTHGIITLSTNTMGGKWSCSSKGKICYVSETGEVEGISEGTDQIMYLISNNCGVASKTKSITVYKGPDAGVIKPVSSDLCDGESIQLSDYVEGGSWSVSNPAGVISGTGLITAIHEGTDTVFYSIKEGHCTARSKKVMTFYEKPNVNGIFGNASLNVGTKATYSSSTPNGIWTINNGNAAINNKGVLLAYTEGESVITYSVTKGPCLNIKTYKVTINNNGK